MKLGKFLLGIAVGSVVTYAVSRVLHPSSVKPEKVIRMVKSRYQDQMRIVGSWIHVEPVKEEMNGIQYNIYRGGLTGIHNDETRFIEFKVDADTGSLLHVKS